MKLYKALLAAVAISASLATTSCSDDFDRPPVILPQATIEANTSILELKEKYWQDGSTDYMTTIGTTDDGDDIIIAGRIVSNDAMGNVYQRVIIEDETSAIAIRVYSSSLSESYHYGQELRINVTGLLIGTYRGLQLIGVDYNGSVGGMDLTDFQARAQINGLPQVDLIPSYVTTIPDLNSYKADPTLMATWQTRLITLENVEFVGGGRETFGVRGGTNYTTQKLRDADGNTIDISTSNKCDFAGLKMPAGKGTITAILSYFGSNWQLCFNNPETECVGFDWEGSGSDEPVNPGDALTSLTENFESGSLPSTWKVETTSGNRSWRVQSFNNNNYAQCSAYNGTAGSDGFKSWLITPALNVDGMTDKVLSFETEIQYGDQEGSLKLYAMTSADPATATLTELQFAAPAAGASGSTGYVASGEISLAQFSGVIYIGWLYEASDAANSRTYRIDNVIIGEKSGATPPTPPAGSAIYTGLTDTSASIDWTFDNVFVPSAITDVWAWTEYSGKHYLKASAYVGGKNYAAESYAVSPAIDLTGATKPVLTFEHAAKFQTTLRSLCGLAVREAGSTTWNVVTIPTWPEAGSWTYVSSGDIDLSAWAGKKIQVGFKYSSSASGADTWQIKNVKIEG